MKKNKKGFTLIELLAIIVILAIIAVITVPIILNVIDNAKRGSIKDSAHGYKDAVSKFYVTKLSEDPTYDLTGTYTVDELKSLGVTVSGNEPITGWINTEKGVITSYMLRFEDNVVTYDKETNQQEIVSLNNIEKPTITVNVTSGGPSIFVSADASGATNLTYYYYIKEYGSSDFTLSHKGDESEYYFTNVDERVWYEVKVVVEDAYGNRSEDIEMIETFCFVAGTKVYTENGYVDIEDIEKGDMVYAIDLETSEQQLKEVLDTYISYGNELYHITIDGETVSSTPRHQFYIVDKGWIRAYDLEVGDEVITKNGTKPISKVEHEYLEQAIPVYNFKVDGLHNYLVTEYSILVHNAGSPA